MEQEDNPITNSKLIAISGFVIVSVFSWLFLLLVDRIMENTQGRADALIIDSTQSTRLSGLARRVLVLEDNIIHDHRMLKYPDTVVIEAKPKGVQGLVDMTLAPTEPRQAVYSRQIPHWLYNNVKTK